MHKHPDILLILANRHRRDYTGAGGGQLVHTPHIDRLAAEGVWFDKAATIFPAPGPSRMSILSGRYPAADAAPVTLAESPLGRCLAAAGYALTEITPAPGPEGLRRTAERARDALAGGTGPRFTLVTLPELDGETDDLPAEVLDLYRGKGIPLAMHHAAVTACDRAVGQILDALAATGRAGTTAVIYSSVVGDQFKFRDAVNRGGHTCYDDCIRVPLVIRGPGGPAGVRLAQIVGLHDLAPTIAAMAGADLAEIYTVASRLEREAEQVFDNPRIQSQPASLSLAQPLIEVHPRWNRAAEVQFSTEDLGFTVAALTDGAYLRVGRQT